MRILLSLFLCGTFLCTVVSSGEVRSPKVEVELGLGGCYKAKRWFPIVIKISPGEGPAMPCRAVATLEEVNRWTKTIYPLRSFVSRFPFGGEGGKTINIPARISPAADRIKLIFQNEATGRTLCAWSFELKPTKRKTALVLTTQPSSFDILSSLPDEVKTVVIPSVELPGSGHLYDSFDLLILDDISFDSIDPVAWEAILNWVSVGRHIIFTENFLKENAAHHAFRTLWPIKGISKYTIEHPTALAHFLGLKSVSLGALQGTEIDLPNKNVFLEEEGHVLAAVRSLGLGRMFLLTFSLDELSVSPPEKDYQVRRDIWSWLTMIEGGKDPLRWDREYTIPETARVKNLSKYILAYLVVVILIILGPLNLFLLKRFNKREYLLVVIPLIVIVLGAIPYFMGRILRGHQAMLNVVGVEFGKGGETRGVGRTYLGLLSSDTREYRLTIEEPDIWPVDKIETGYRFRERGEVGRYPIEVDFQREDTLISNLRMPLWSMRFFRLGSFRRYGGPLEYEIDLQGDSLGGHLTNRLGFDLKDACLIYRYQHIYLGEIKDDATVSWKLPLPGEARECYESESSACSACAFPDTIFTYRLWHKERFSKNELEIFQDVFQNFQAQFESPVLLTRTQRTQEEFSLNRPTWKENKDTFAFFALPLHLKTLDIPFGLCRRRVISARSTPFSMRVSGENSLMVEYDLPIHINEPIETESVSLRFVTVFHRKGSGHTPSLTLEAYDWGDDLWKAIGTTTEESKIFQFPEPGRFVHFPGGLIRVRVSMQPSQEQGGFSINKQDINGLMMELGRMSESMTKIRCLDIAYLGHKQDE